MHFAGCLLVPDSIVCALQPPAGHDVFEWSIIQAFGIFAVSVSGHSSLPVLRNSMAKPQVSVGDNFHIKDAFLFACLPACQPGSGAIQDTLWQMPSWHQGLHSKQNTSGVQVARALSAQQLWGRAAVK